MSGDLSAVERAELRRRGYDVVRREPAASLLGTHLQLLFEQERIGRVLDVGARTGEFGTWLRDQGYAGHLVSFEPIARNVDRLREAAAADPLWDVHALALGAEDATAPIHVSEQTHFSSFLTASPAGLEQFPHMQVTDTESVVVRALDGWLDRHDLAPVPTYLKLDTQGFDLEVLRGAPRALAGPVVALQSEVSVRPIYEGMPDWREAVREIESLGFALSGMFPVSLTERLEVIEWDCVAVRTSDVSGG